jgi:hypothetical protein
MGPNQSIEIIIIIIISVISCGLVFPRWADDGFLNCVCAAKRTAG